MDFNFTMVFLITNIILALALIFLERRNPTATLAWILILMFIPWLGFILYLFLGQNLRKQKIFTLKSREDLIRISARQEKMLAEHRLDFNNPSIQKTKDLIYLNSESSKAVFSENNRITILNNGAEKFPALIESLKQAKDHIHMVYYIIRDDQIGRAIRDILVQKAKEGVEIRLLYDGMGCIFLNKKYFKPLIEAGGEIVPFLPPFLPYINIRVNYRNHRKITIIDGQKAFTGGLNLGDEYLGKSPKYGFWRDIHLMLQGSAVDPLQLRFIVDWQFACQKGFEDSDRYFPPKKYVGNAGIQVVSSGPDSQWASIRQGYFKMITRAEKRLYIETPYLVPDDSLAEALKIAALGGVDVRIIIPSMPDHPFVYWASTSYMGDLLEAGARAYLYNNGFMHSKLIIADDTVASVGTANLDIRSFETNFEVNTFIYDKNAVKELESAFLNDLKFCKEITLEDYNNRPLRMRFKESISRLLSPLL